MDVQSIITQVSRDEDHAEEEEEEAPTTTTATTSRHGSASKKPRYHRFTKLFCCFRQDMKTQSPLLLPSDASARNSAKMPFLLPKLRHQDMNKKCVVIDLDETLVHSSFKPVSNADFVVPVEIDGIIHQVYVLKRPYVDEFLQKMGELFECVLFTASLAKYADPVADLLDKWGIFRIRLFRDSCIFHRGNYVKDLSRLGRDLSQVIIVDNSPASYIFHPDNAVPVTSWFDDMSDTELLDLIPFFESVAKVNSTHGMLPGAHMSMLPIYDISINATT